MTAGRQSRAASAQEFVEQLEAAKPVAGRLAAPELPERASLAVAPEQPLPSERERWSELWLRQAQAHSFAARRSLGWVRSSAKLLSQEQERWF